VPSIGGGTKLIRTLLAGEGEGVCSGLGEAGTDCSGEIEGEGDSSVVGEGVGVGDSCASAAKTHAEMSAMPAQSFIEIRSGAQRSRRIACRYVLVSSRGFLDFARNDSG
jgi:hypothetical protein